MHVAEAGLAPVPLDGRHGMTRVEAFDARTQERADRGPLRGDQATGDRKPDPRVQPPERTPDAARQAELDHRNATAGLHDARELVHRGCRIVDVAQQISEREVIELFVGERQALRPRFDDPLVDTVAGPRHVQHVHALIEPDDGAAVAIVERLRDHPGAGRDVEDAVRRLCVDGLD